ncbi:hypothetical protein KI387_015999, partial [Taxus chinensis]
LPSLFLNLHLVPEQNSGPVKVWKRDAAEREEIGDVFAAFESLCSLVQTSQPSSLPPPHPPVPSRCLEGKKILALVHSAPGKNCY